MDSSNAILSMLYFLGLIIISSKRLYNSVLPIDRTQNGATNMSSSGPKGISNEGIGHISPTSS